MRSLDVLAILTADRPHLAERCAESYLANHSHPGELLLMDDSSGEAASAVPELAASLARTYGLPTRYASRATRRDYVSQLTKLGIPPDVATFTLIGDACVSFTGGANRNAALLDSAGQQLLMADDDTVATTAIPAATSERSAVTGHYEPSDIDFFPNGASRSAARWSPVDLVAETASLLGSPVSQLNACGCPASADATIRMTTCGVVGDSGYFSPAHLLWLCPDHVYERLRQSEPLLNNALSSREVIRMVPSLTVTHATPCMATTFGLDHTSPLPPFLPIGRNEDGFFGKLMLRVFPAACTAYLPCAVLHDPPGARAYARLPHQPQTIRFAELLMLLMGACPDGSLHALGTFLVEISGDGLESFARDVVRKSREQMLRLIEHRQLRASTPASPAWLHQAAMLKSSVSEFIGSPECWLPSDIPAAEPRRTVALTGRMLIHWPEIVAAAQRLATDGVRITASFTKR